MCTDTTTTSHSATDAALCSASIDIWENELPVALSFESYAIMLSLKFTEIEKVINKQLDRLTVLRIRQIRKLFNVKPSKVIDILRDLASAFEGAVITKCDDGDSHQFYLQLPNATKTERKEQKTLRLLFDLQHDGSHRGRHRIFRCSRNQGECGWTQQGGVRWLLVELFRFLLHLSGRQYAYNSSEPYQGVICFTHGGKTH